MQLDTVFNRGVSVHGDVDLSVLDPIGNIVRFCRYKNAIVYQAADILAEIFAGRLKASINTMYIEYYNYAEVGSHYSPPVVDLTDTCERYTTLDTINHDYLRVPIINTIGVSSTGVSYEGNRLTYNALSGSFGPGQLGRPFGGGNQSYVYSAGLVVAPDPTSSISDKLFSRLVFPEIEIEAGYQLAVTWNLSFT